VACPWPAPDPGRQVGQQRAQPAVVRPEVVPPVGDASAPRRPPAARGCGTARAAPGPGTPLFNRSGLTSSTSILPSAPAGRTSSQSSVFAEFTVRPGCRPWPPPSIWFRIRAQQRRDDHLGPMPPGALAAARGHEVHETADFCTCTTPARGRPCATSACTARHWSSRSTAAAPASARSAASASARNGVSVLASLSWPHAHCPHGERLPLTTPGPGSPARPAARRAGTRTFRWFPRMSGGTREPHKVRDVAPQGAREPRKVRDVDGRCGTATEGAVRPRKCATCTGNAALRGSVGQEPRGRRPRATAVPHTIFRRRTPTRRRVRHPQRVSGAGQLKRLRPTISFMISLVPPKMDCTRASRNALAIGVLRHVAVAAVQLHAPSTVRLAGRSHIGSRRR